MLGQTGRGTGLEQEWAPLAVGSAKTILRRLGDFGGMEGFGFVEG